MPEEGAAGLAQKTGTGIGTLVTWLLVAVAGFAGYAKPGWPFSFKDVAVKLLGWLGIANAGTNISVDDIGNLVAGAICGGLGGTVFVWGYRHGGATGAAGKIGGAWLLGKAIRHTLAGVGVK